MYKMITYELRCVRDIVSGGKSLARHIASILESELKGLPGYWLELFQLALIGLLEKDRDQLLTAEQVLLAERRKERGLRGRRIQAKTDLYKLLLKARSFLEVAVGQGAAVDLLGLEPKLGQVEALVLVRHGFEAADELASPDFKPGVFVIDGVVMTSQDYADSIRTATERLEDLDDHLADQERATEQALKVKTEVLERLHVRSGLVARILEDLYLLAGEGFYAERLRRVPRRRGSLPENDDGLAVDPAPDEDGEPGTMDRGVMSHSIGVSSREAAVRQGFAVRAPSPRVRPRRGPPGAAKTASLKVSSGHCEPQCGSRSYALRGNAVPTLCVDRRRHKRCPTSQPFGA